jgi:hypothetical protein
VSDYFRPALVKLNQLRDTGSQNVLGWNSHRSLGAERVWA